MRKTVISRFERALARIALVLALGAGALLLAPPAQADWHGHWHGGWCCGWGVGVYGWPAYPYPYYPDYYAYYPPPAPVVAAPAAPAAPPSAPAAANTWYYCTDSKAYYPYVQTCASAWQPVPAAPPK